MSNFGKVAVLLGGKSSEREVSLNSGAGVLAALRRQGVDAQAFDPAERRLDELAAYDRAFIMLHGRYGEDGTIQGLLELMGIPYTGSGVMASAVGMDKWRTKLLWRSVGLPIPDFVMLAEDSDFAAVERQLGLPLFVKPACEGSSIGVIKVSRAGELRSAYRQAAQYDSLVLAEHAVLGGEYTVGIVGEETLPIIRIVPATEFYVDFLMDEAGKAYFLEVNTSPGMTDHSLVPMAARVAGISYEQLVLRVLEQASLA